MTQARQMVTPGQRATRGGSRTRRRKVRVWTVRSVLTGALLLGVIGGPATQARPEAVVVCGISPSPPPTRRQHSPAMSLGEVRSPFNPAIR